MENDEQHRQAANSGAAPSTEAGRHDRGHSRKRSAEGYPDLAVDREGALLPETPQDPNSADWRFLYSLVRARYQDESKRGESLDQKIGVLLAGAIAAIAFTYANGPTGWWSLVLLLFLLPLWFLFQAFRTRLGKDAPKTESLANSYPYYPTTTLRVAISDMVAVRQIDRALNDQKANRIDKAMATLGLAFVAVLFVQIGWRVTQAAPLPATWHGPLSVPVQHAREPRR